MAGQKSTSAKHTIRFLLQVTIPSFPLQRKIKAGREVEMRNLKKLEMMDVNLVLVRRGVLL